MKFTDYLLLAVTKVRTRKMRSILTMLSASVLLVFLFVGSFSYTGARNSIKNAVHPGLVDKHIAVEDASGTFFGFEGDVLSEDTGSPAASYDVSDGAYATKVEPFDPVMTHTQTNLYSNFWQGEGDQPQECFLNGGGFFGAPEELSSQCVNGAIRSDQFFDYFTSDGYSVSGHTDDSTPVIVGTQYALDLMSEQFTQDDSAEDKIAKVARATDALIGDRITMSFTASEDMFGGPTPEDFDFDPNSPAEAFENEIAKIEAELVQVKIVGILPATNQIKDIAGVASYGVDDVGIVFPESRAPESLLRLAAQPGAGVLHRFTEFSSVRDLDRYIDAGCKGSECYDGRKVEHRYFTDYDKAIERTLSQAWTFLRWVLLVWGIGVGFSVMSTTAKVIVDSRKEIGVFRAIGAKRSQIFGVYATYVTILGIIALVLSFCIARLITSYQNSRFADDISVQIALINGSSDPLGHFTFFGIDVKQMGAIVLFIIAVSLLGSAIPVMRNLRKDPLRYLRDD